MQAILTIMLACFVRGFPRTLGVATLALVSAGCGSSDGPERVPLHGTIRVDGDVVTEGAITFLPAAGNSGPAASTAVVDGRYEFTEANGPVAGEHRAVLGVVATGPAGGNGAKETAAAVRQGSGGAIKSAPPAGGDGGGETSAASSGQLEIRMSVPAEGDFRVNLGFKAS